MATPLIYLNWVYFVDCDCVLECLWVKVFYKLSLFCSSLHLSSRAQFAAGDTDQYSYTAGDLFPDSSFGPDGSSLLLNSSSSTAASIAKSQLQYSSTNGLAASSSLHSQHHQQWAAHKANSRPFSTSSISQTGPGRSSKSKLLSERNFGTAHRFIDSPRIDELLQLRNYNSLSHQSLVGKIYHP